MRSIRIGACAGCAWALFIGCPSAAAAELQVGPPRAVDPEPAWISSAEVPAGLASNGMGWLALTAVDWGSHSLSATRIGADGNVLDRPSIPIAAVERIFAPSLSFDGTHYVAAWGDQAGSDQPVRIRLQRIASNGTLFGDTLTVGSIDTTVRVLVAISSGENSDLLAWCETPVLFGESICSWAQVEGSSVVATDSMTFSPGLADLDVEASGDSWLAALTTTNGDVFVVRVGSDGLVVDDPPIALAASGVYEYATALAPAQSGWAAIWQAGGALQSGLVSSEGAVAINPTPLLDDSTILEDASVERTPDGFALVGTAGAEIWVRSLAPDLTPVSEFTTAETGQYPSTPQASWGGSSLLVDWDGDHSGYVSPGVFATRFSSDGEVLDPQPIVISTRQSDQRTPSAARGADSWLVVWEDNRSSNSSMPAYMFSDIYAQRLDDTGAPVSENPIPIAVTESFERLQGVAGSPSGWFVIWQGDEDVLATRVSPSGTVLDQDPIILEGVTSPASVAFDGTYWVVGGVSTSDGVVGTTRLVRIDSTGKVLDDPPIAVSAIDSALVGVPVDISVDSLGYAVAWMPESGGLLVRHVGLDGTPVESSPSYVLGAEVPIASHELLYQDGDGWVFWHGSSNLNLQWLGAAAPAQVSKGEGAGYDLAAVGTRALAAWNEADELKLGVAAPGGLLEVEAALLGTFGPKLAVEDETRALLVSVTEEGAPVRSSRIYARVLDIAPFDAGGAGGDGTGGEGPDSSTGGSSAGEGGAGNAGKGNGGVSDPEGEAGASGAREPGTANGGNPPTGEAGSSTAEHDDDRNVAGCTCRVGHQGVALGAPFSSLLVALVFRLRRRRTPPTSLRQKA